jgi:hypothetical protein
LDEGIQAFQEVWAIETIDSDSKIGNTFPTLLFVLRILGQQLNLLVDPYLDDLRKSFVINMECCDQFLDPDESVLHCRNFATELRQSRGREDVSPSSRFRTFLDSCNPATTFASARGRFEDSSRTAGSRHFRSRRGMQEFRFLAMAEKELVGNF